MGLTWPHEPCYQGREIPKMEWYLWLDPESAEPLQLQRLSAFQLQSWMYQQPCHISSTWWPWSPAQVGCGEPVLSRIEFREGVRVPVELYMEVALMVLFQTACLSLSSRHNSPASLWTGFSPWTSWFSHFIWLARRIRSVLLREGYLRTSCLAWDFAR